MVSGIKSAKAKLVRAAKHLHAIKRRIAAYAGTKPHKIVKKAKGKKKLNVPKPPPTEISLLAGEMIYQMRSALDCLVFDLVKRNPNVSAIAPDWEDNCQFPMRVRLPKEVLPLSKSAFSRDLPGIADAPFAFIESVQPYYGFGAVNNSLRFLRYLSNIDKHRHLNLLRPRIRQHQSVRYPGGLSGSGHMILDRGAEIYPAPPMRPLRGLISAEPEKPVYVKRHYRAVVAFNERRYLGEATTLPVDYLLELILHQIKTVIVPAFEKILEKP
jgi:hypothetical protein